MDLVGWRDRYLDPVDEFDRLQEEINRLFSFSRPAEGLFDRGVSPALDLMETEGEFLVLCDLPGIEREDLDVSVAAGVLTVKGAKREEARSENAKLYKKESWEGSFQRTLSLPATADPAQVQAVFKDGVLKITIAKREEARARRIALKAE